jgi:hypothetical protein
MKEIWFTLRNFCRYPLMMTGVSGADLLNLNWRIPPTPQEERTNGIAAKYSPDAVIW